MKKAKAFLSVAVVILISVCCRPQEGQERGKRPRGHFIGPVAIIYKTRKDYSKNVPVTLSADKSKIVSYPAPNDLFFNGKLAYPTPLIKGYLLDNRGVSRNTVFLKITYEEYSKLTASPNLDSLYQQIADKDPITEIYNMGQRYHYKNIVPELDSLIEHHHLKEFKKLK